MATSVEVGPIRVEIEELKWSTTEVRFRGFADLNSRVGDFVESPVFTCCGIQWSVDMYPVGDGHAESDDVMTSMYLCNNSSEEVKARYATILRGPDGTAVDSNYSYEEGHVFEPSSGGEGHCWGASDFVKRSTVMESLVEGAMVVEVKIMRMDTISKSPFVPENPNLKNSLKLFMDKETADIIFTVGIRNKKKKGKRKRGDESTDFHAHHHVLEHNAPVLAEFCRPGEGGGSLPVTVPIEGVDADIFRHLLCYVYGGEIEGEDLKTRAREIIGAADKYGVASLKLLAEARYVESTKLSIENMMEYLLFADAKNCALMKEAVMDFILANDAEVLQKVSFRDCPGDLVKDLLAATARSKWRGKSNDMSAEDRFVAMQVDDLRRELHEKRLDVDGSREAMIAALRESS